MRERDVWHDSRYIVLYRGAAALVIGCRGIHLFCSYCTACLSGNYGLDVKAVLGYLLFVVQARIFFFFFLPGLLFLCALRLSCLCTAVVCFHETSGDLVSLLR